jgi:hypothetical protein
MSSGITQAFVWGVETTGPFILWAVVNVISGINQGMSPEPRKPWCSYDAILTSHCGLGWLLKLAFLLVQLWAQNVPCVHVYWNPCYVPLFRTLIEKVWPLNAPIAKPRANPDSFQKWQKVELYLRQLQGNTVPCLIPSSISQIHLYPATWSNKETTQWI